MVELLAVAPNAADNGQSLIADPGNTLRLTWSARPESGIQGPFVARLYVSDRSVLAWESEATSARDAATPQPIIILPSNAPPALLRVGLRWLRLEVSGRLPSGESTLLGVDQVLLLVRRQLLLPADTWRWVSPGTDDHGWKQTFQPQAQFTNITRATPTATTSLPLSGTFVLTEERLDLGGPPQLTQRFPDQTVSLAPGAQTLVTFPQRTHNWQWILPVVFIPTGDTLRVYRYAADATMRDPWGNEFRAAHHRVLVIAVPAGKVIAGAAALAGATAAVTLAGFAAAALAGVFTAIAAPALFAAAGFAYGAASAAYALAIDPPEPDPKFRDKVEVESLELPSEVAKDPRLAPCCEVLKLLHAISSHGLALSAIEGKFLGAKQAKDAAAQKKQRDHFVKVTENVEKLGKATEALIKNLKPFADDEQFDRYALSWAHQVARDGISKDFEKRWAAEKLPADTLKAIATFVSHPDALPQLRGLRGTVLGLAASLRPLASDIVKEARAKKL